MPTLLESNPAGDLALIESGCYGYTGTRANGYQFDDATLADWTVRWSDSTYGVAGGKLTAEMGLLLMWSKESVSPTHKLPNVQVITTLRSTWNASGGYDERNDYVTNAVASMHPTILPWDTGGFATGSGGHIWFGELWRPWRYANSIYGAYHTGMVAVPAKDDHWSGIILKPDAASLSRDCSGGGLNLVQGAHGFQPDAPFTWSSCDGVNYGMSGYPGLVSWSNNKSPVPPGVPGEGTEYLEWHAFYDTFIKVIGLPTGWQARAIKNGDVVRSAQTSNGIESGGQATLPVIGFGDGDMPPWDEVQVLDTANVVMSTIQVRTFQPGTYGGDVYCYRCSFPCPPSDLASFFFFGQQTTPPASKTLATALDAELLRETAQRVTTSLDAALLKPNPMTQTVVGLVQEDDFNRADWVVPGPGWVQRDGDNDIVSNFLRSMVGTSYLENDTGAAALEWFAQVSVRWSHWVFNSGLGFADYNAGSENGYLIRLEDGQNRIRLERWVNGSSTLIKSLNGVSMSTDTWYPDFQFYIKDSAQECYFKGDAASGTVSDTDSTHDGVLKLPYLRSMAGAPNTGDFDDAIICLTKSLVVTGLSAGWKAKILNASATVVAEAVESGGVATIDASLFGGATERVAPGGWPVLSVTDAADLELKRWDSANAGFVGVYPGNQYAY